MIASGEEGETRRNNCQLCRHESDCEVSEAGSKLTDQVVRQLLLKRSFKKLSHANLMQSQTTSPHVVSLHSTSVTCFSAICCVWSNNLERALTNRKSGPNQPDRSWVFCTAVSDANVGQSYSRQRQGKTQRCSKGTPLRKAPARGSELTGTAIEKFSRTRRKQNLSVRRPHAARRWCAQLRKTVAQESVLEAPTGAAEPVARAHRESSARPQNRDSAMCCLGWTGQKELRQIQRVCNHISEYTHLRCLSLAWRQRGVWRNPAPEDAKNILAQRNNKQKAQASRGVVSRQSITVE